MDFIKLGNTTADKTVLDSGSPIEGFKTALWVEKYQEPGEFKFEALQSSGLMGFLPIGTFVSHLRSTELMMVENIEVEQSRSEDPTIAISGRSLTAFLEERIVGQNWVETPHDNIPDYTIAAADSWDQIQGLIYDHIVTAGPASADNSLPGVDVVATVTGSGTSEDRNLQYGTIWDRVAELLKVDDVGIRCNRPLASDSTHTTTIEIFAGENKANAVKFSWQNGDLENIKYLFSNKSLKTSARVMGRWVQVVVQGTPDNIDRRWMLVDASAVDQQQPSMPTSTALTLIKAAMTIRGREALKKQQRTYITDADVSANSSLRYRDDYVVGDLVTVDGDFGAQQIMRVTEFAESEDENGSSGHPTLSIPGE